MNSTLYFQYLTKQDYCPDCNGLLIHGVFREKDRTVWSVCLSCGYEREIESGFGKKKGRKE